MSRPKLPSEKHPDYPKYWKMKYEEFYPARVKFYAEHPEFDNEGDYEFRCEMCGNNIDEDHCYCENCGDHSGDWILVDVNGEEI